MIQDIEDGKIDVVLVKDQSCLGREHLQTGYYMEIFFANHDVRFIAVNDNVDTDKLMLRYNIHTSLFILTI